MTLEIAWSLIVGIWWGLLIGAVALSPIAVVVYLIFRRFDVP